MDSNSRWLPALLHDLKNPVIAIERLADLLLEEERLPAEVQHKVELIHRSAEEAVGYLTEVDGAAPPPQLAEDLARTRVDLAALSERVVERFRPLAEYKDQTLQAAGLAEAAPVQGDERHLRDAMSNLVSNALKYSPRGATVDVRVEHSDDRIRFSVTDQGPGLHDDELSRLFVPYQRLSSQPTDGEVSSGLGLYLVREVARRHDGQVDVETSVGEGSTFALVLPAASVAS
jgi:signal transduction histidine kinase